MRKNNPSAENSQLHRVICILRLFVNAPRRAAHVVNDHFLARRVYTPESENDPYYIEEDLGRKLLMFI